ncbi:MAG: exo-alpha-sialidase [Bacteroidales bacterium]|nr:exo-alpha-sialidase [Bacteroidales bacterium]
MKLPSGFCASLSLVLCLLPVSCNREDGPVEGTVLEAVLDKNRTSLDGTQIFWSEGDVIFVNGNSSSSIEIQEGGSSARFSFQKTVSAPFYALYPAQNVISGSYSPGSMDFGTVTLPSVQHCAPGCFDPEAALMHAQAGSEVDALHFSCGVAFLKLTIEGTGGNSAAIKRIELHALNGEDLCGDLRFLPSERKFADSGSNGAAVSVICGEGLPLGGSVYVAIEARNYASGLGIRLIDSENHFRDIKSAKAFAAEAGTVYLTTVPFSPTGTIIDGQTEEFQELNIEWGSPVQICSGGYGRIKRLADGKLLLAYSNGGNINVRPSTNNGSSWGSAVPVMKSFNVSNSRGSALVVCANPEFAQISAANPDHPGRIIMAGNFRPRVSSSDTSPKPSIYPYSIAISHSDDGGASWSDTTVVYRSKRWSDDASKGCWEPFVLELPDGTLQIYFTDNTPYGANNADDLPYVNTKGNNISVIESHDGGDSWSGERIVCHTESPAGMGWDGMPVATLIDGRIFLAVEHKDIVGGNYPMTIQLNSTQRFYPFVQSTALNSGCYRGAPYIITTDNYVVLSYQSAEGSSSVFTSENSVPEVRAISLEEWKNGSDAKMDKSFRPMPGIDQTADSGLWNSLCDLGEDRIFCVTQYKGRIYITQGKISGK